MKINEDAGPSLVIGKRIPVGQVVGGIGAALAFAFPDNAPLIAALTVPAIGITQMIVVNFFGVTK